LYKIAGVVVGAFLLVLCICGVALWTVGCVFMVTLLPFSIDKYISRWLNGCVYAWEFFISVIAVFFQPKKPVIPTNKKVYQRETLP